MKLQELFADESKWTKCSNSTDEDGNEIPVINTDGPCFCLMEGICKIYAPLFEEYKIYRRITNHLKIESISDWNDAPERTFSDIRKLIEELDI